MDCERLKQSFKSYGINKTIQGFGMSLINRIICVKILKGIKIEKANPDFLKCNERYRCLFLGHAELQEFSKDPEYDLLPQFLDEAFEKGDECHAILDGPRLAAYGWYSSQPTAYSPGLQLHFDSRYIYMYKGFTHCNYRGQRLHAVGMTRALVAYLERGFKGIVSIVEWNNFASLNSCYRMGYEDFGNLYVLGFLGRFLLHSSSECKQYALGLDREGPHRNREFIADGIRYGLFSFNLDEKKQIDSY